MDFNSSNDKINEIRQQADIVDIVSRHINVIHKGKSYVAICPFHNDTNPSMSISKDKQIFKCFVCNEGGNVFTFIQKFKKIPYIQAVKEVADIVGIDFKTKEDKPAEIMNSKQKVVYDIIKDTILFYKNSLVSNKEAFEYCQNRDITPAIINEFNIGFSPDSDRLVSFLIAKGYKKQDIYRTGIVNENNGELKDRFAHRLIFPITDLTGNVVAFSGRIIQKSDQAKYVNSPETELFTKGNTLYHYASALPSIKKEKKLYLCEGFMDCIALCKAGITNSVALMGTAFTKEHLRIFKYLGVDLVLCLDGDGPGNMNANKLANQLLELGMTAKVIPHYEDVKDIDEYVSKYGAEALINHFNKVEMNAFDFNFYIASKSEELKNNENKKKFLKVMCKKIAKMSMEDIDIYSNKLHDELGFSLSTINKLIEESKEKETETVINEVKSYEKLTKLQELQLRVLAQMLDSPEAIDIFVNELIYLEDESYRKIGLLIGEYYSENKDHFSMNNLEADLYTKISTEYSDDEELDKTLTSVYSSKENYPGYSKESFDDLLYELQEIAPLEERINKIADDVKFANSTDEIKDLIRESVALKAALKEKRAKRRKG